MKQCFTALVLFVCLLGCTRTIYTPVIQSRTVIDTVVAQLADSAMIRALFECDSAGNVLMTELHQVKGRMAEQSFDFGDNELRVETRWKTKVVDRFIEVRDTVSVVQIQEVIRREAYIPSLFKWCFVVALFVVGWGVVKICARLR